jgi:hypothetical protein
MNYLCSVSSSLVHNYNLGIQSGVWGVEDKYASRIAGVTPGDLLVFLVDRHFRSIHEITEGPYVDATPIWEPRESDYFRHRVRFGDAVASGSLRIACPPRSLLPLTQVDGVGHIRLPRSPVEQGKQ